MKSRDRRYEFFLQVRRTSYHGIVVFRSRSLWKLSKGLIFFTRKAHFTVHQYS